jgi:membrane protein
MEPANFDSYNKRYGSLGAVFGCMRWNWLTNIGLLVGAEINAKTERRAAANATGSCAT